MRVLGIDPGYDRLGIAIMEKISGKETLLFSTCLESNRNATLNERIGWLGQELQKVIKEYQPEQLAIEKLFFNQNRTTAIAVAEVRGVAIYLAGEAGCEIAEFGPQEIKVAATGYGKSDKKAIVDMLKRLVSNIPPQALDDEYDAIAIALTALTHHRPIG